jgi:hypothetical protein
MDSLFFESCLLQHHRQMYFKLLFQPLSFLNGILFFLNKNYDTSDLFDDMVLRVNFIKKIA